MSGETEGPDEDSIPQEAPQTALVEISPGTALVFGQVPAGLDLVPFRLVSPGDQLAISNAVAASSSILNVGAQVANGLAQASGLVRLAPETLAAIRAGAEPIKSGGYYLGTLRVGNEFSNSVRWLPASGATTVGVLASVGPAVAMIAIQMQLNEVAGLVRENIALTESVLKTVRNEQWAELTGLDQTVTRALSEATAVGEVTPSVWDNIAGHEPELRKHRDLFRRNVEAHSAALAKLKGHQERRQYIERSGEALILDLHSLVLAHKSWFEYQALRAGRIRLNASESPTEAKLLKAIVDNAQTEYVEVVDQMAGVLETVTRELSIIAELPGKRTIPFTDGRRSAHDVARMAQELLAAVENLSESVQVQPAPLERPTTVYLDADERIDQDLRILRWLLAPDEEVLAIVVASSPRSGALESLGNKTKRGLGSFGAAAEATLRRRDILEAAATGYERPDSLIAVTGQRVLVADLVEYRTLGVIRRSVPNTDIRYVRVRDSDPSGQTEVDLITREDNLTWRFAKASTPDSSVKTVAALLAAQMEIPDAERASLISEMPAGAEAPSQLTS